MMKGPAVAGLFIQRPISGRNLLGVILLSDDMRQTLNPSAVAATNKDASVVLGRLAGNRNAKS